MKKLLISVLLLTSVVISVFTVNVSADFGKGVEIAAQNITMVKSGLRGEKICFSDADFKAALCLTSFESITINSLPGEEGTLLFAGRKIGVGKTIRRKNIPSLVFIPSSPEVTESSFSFTVKGSVGNNPIKCTLKFIDDINLEPAINQNDTSIHVIKTQEQICTHGKMEATDPEGDDVDYIIVSYPKNGYITVTDEKLGKYRYTPINGYVGKDSFVYVARDSYGNYSTPATVKVNVTKRMCDVEYKDMTERNEYNAAVAMTALGIMNGSIRGDSQYFDPEGEVTKAEFLAMAMKAKGIRQDSTVTRTFFDDNDDIPKELIGYVGVAQRSGIIKGDFINNKLVFSPNEAITRYDAARIMSELLTSEVEPSEESVFAEDDDVPLSARAHVNAMYSIGVYDESTIDLCGKVTRADAAEYLYRLINK